MATATALPAPIAPEPAVGSHRGHPIFGALLALRDDRLDTLLELGTRYDIARFRLLHQPAVLLSHPAAIQRVLVDNAKSYTKHTFGYRRMRAVLGNGLVTSEGDFWLRQRRIAQPAFHKPRIEAFAELMTRAASDMVARWPAEGELGLDREMMRVTLRVVGEALLSRDVTAEADGVGDALPVVLHHVMKRITSPWSFPESWPTPQNRRFRRALSTLDAVVAGMLDDRRAAAQRGEAARGDLLDMLLASEDSETGERMNDAQLRDEVMTMFLAGHETTAMALTWTVHLLTQHPDVQEAVAREVDEVLGGRAPTLADFGRLELTGRVIDESMRLYPPVWMVARNAEADDEILGHRIRPGDYVFMSTWVTHRRPDLWPDPERFDPDRFLPERAAGRHKFAFFPFIGGKRKCIGDHFALLEARLILAVMVQRARFSAVGDTPPVPDPLVTLRPRDGLRVAIAPR
jgi:cytochrome P450